MSFKRTLTGIVIAAGMALTTGCGRTYEISGDFDGDGTMDYATVQRSRAPQGTPMAQLETKIIYHQKKADKPINLLLIKMPRTKEVPCDPVYVITPTQPQTNDEYKKVPPNEVQIEPEIALFGSKLPEINLLVQGKVENKEGKKVEVDRKFILHTSTLKRLSTYAARETPAKDRYVTISEAGIPKQYIVNHAN